MPRTVVGVLAACLAAVLVAGAGADEKNTKDSKDKKALDDKTFVMKAASGNMHEVKLGELASKMGTATEVKEFGQRMVKDHTKSLGDLKKAALAAGIDVPQKMSKHHQDHVARFEKMDSKSFDKAYVRHMIHDHEEDVALFEQAGKDVKDPDLRKYADKTLPVIRDHLKMIKKVGDTLGVKGQDKRK
jgi:putative membrane protein